MIKNIRFLFIAITIFTVILSACGGTTIPVTGSEGTLQAPPATFIAAVENITGDQWTLSGQTLTVDPAVVNEGPFTIGDLVKVEVVINQNGTFAVSSVEAPTVQELSTLPRLDDGNSNSNANTNDNVNGNGNANINSNDNTGNVNSNDNTNDTNSNVNNNSNDNNGNQNNNDNDNGGNDNGDDENDNDSSGSGSGGNNNDENDNDSSGSDSGDNDDNDNG